MKLKHMNPDERESHIVTALTEHWGYAPREAYAVLKAHEGNVLGTLHGQVMGVMDAPPYARRRANEKWTEGVRAALGVVFTRQSRLLEWFETSVKRSERIDREREQELHARAIKALHGRAAEPVDD